MPLHSTIQRRATFPMRELVEQVCRPLSSRLSSQAVHTVIDVPEDQMVSADHDLLRRAVRNLILNAVDAMPQGGSLVVTSAAGPDAIELEVADTGPALSDEELQEAFELLPSAQRSGTGWGLAVVHRIAELHGGRVTAVNCPEGGAAFTLRIPQAAALEAAA